MFFKKKSDKISSYDDILRKAEKNLKKSKELNIRLNSLTANLITQNERIMTKY